MVARMLQIEVEGRAGVEVAAPSECPKTKDGLCADERSACASLLDAVVDELTARAVDHAGGDRKRGVVGEVVATHS